MNVFRDVMRTMRVCCAFVLLLGPTADALAEGEITLSNTVEKVEYFANEQGEMESRFVEAATVIPGDELAYTITFENVSDDVTVDAGSVVITNPIPPEVVYLERTAFGAGTVITYSADGGEVFGIPDALVVVEEDGERVAAAAEYTHIRWTFEPALEPGQTGRVSFRARLR